MKKYVLCNLNQLFQYLEEQIKVQDHNQKLHYLIWSKNKF